MWRDTFQRITTRKRVVAAYHAFAEGGATKDDTELIINDLARESGFFRTHGGDAFEEGKRSLFLYMAMLFRMSPDQTQHYAAREWREDDDGSGDERR